MSEKDHWTRRGLLKGIGSIAGAAALGGPLEAGEGPDEAAGQSPPPRGAPSLARALEDLVARTPIVDTHEHLPDEDERLRGQRIACDDWAVLLSHYIDSDLVSAGLPEDSRRRLLSRDTDPLEKWRLVAPWWPAARNTGYGRVVRIALRDLYGVDDLSEATVPRIQKAYEDTRKPGFYRRILVERANIESCQVNYLWRPFGESQDPLLLMQDLSIKGMHMGPDIGAYAGPAKKEVKDLADWHAVIAWWFDTYGPYAVAVKSQAAYARGLDFEKVPPERAEPVFRKVLAKDLVGPEERKLLEDHLFWHCVGKATEHGLPVKLHAGYYAGANDMPLGRLAANPAQASDLCRRSPATTFVFMHIAYPYWQELVAVAKHYTNACIDMCWAWIVDPQAAKGFLKSFLAAAPSSKVLTFGGDYIPVECVLGHARIARQGIARALLELVEEGTLEAKDAMDLVEPLLRGNGHRIFRINEKAERLRKAPWARSEAKF